MPLNEGGRGPGGYTPADAVAASAAVADFWAALALDDDALVMAATASGIHDAFGTDPGLCGRVRDALEVTREACDRMGTSSKVRVVDGWMVFVCIEGGEDRQPVLIGSWGPEQRKIWGLWTVFRSGHWSIGGTYLPPPEGWPDDTEYLDLPHAPPLTGPIQ